MSRSALGWARLAGAAAILAVLVWRLGTGPFLDGDPRGRRPVPSRRRPASRSLTTVCCAWRWRSWPAASASTAAAAAVAAYYRSQFLNMMLPGGVAR